MAFEQKTVELEVSSLLWHKHELEVCKRELESYKTLYWEVQLELDRIVAMRKKNIRYSTLRRQKALENVGLCLKNGGARSHDGNKREPDIGCDCDCDCDCDVVG